MKKLASWTTVNAAMYGFRDYLKEPSFAGL
jgi:hypothetical protein